MAAIRAGRGYLIWISLLLAGLASADAARGTSAAPPPIPGRLVLRTRGGLSPDALQRALSAVGARRVKVIAGIDGTVIEADEASLARVAARLRRSGLFSSVEREQRARIAEPNDPYYPGQWGLPRSGVPAAWDLSSGAGITVAVVDTGIDASHPDLQGQVLAGYDFLNDDPDPADDNGHGTRMSGIIGALCDNGEGVCGVAPATTILPLKALDAQGYGPYSAIASGIIYAVDHGARVVNLSLVGTAPSSILQAAVDYAVAHDVVVVAATGNYGTDTPGYPAASNGVVAVAAINDGDGHPSFSDYGAWVSVSAPGIDIITATAGGGYATSTGTSPAAAIGSGVFALLLAANPAMDRATAIARVEAGAVDLGSSGWDPYFGWGRVDAYGALVPGEIGAPPPDETPPTVSILSPTKGSLLSNMVAVDVAANDNVALGRVELFVDNRWYATMTTPPYSFVIDASTLPAGSHKLRAYAYDTSNNMARTRNVKVWFTPGTGLLVTHLVVKASSVSLSGQFALPVGTVFDPATDDVTITLASTGGTVLAATAEAGSFEVSSSGKMRGTVAPNVPSSGSVRLTAKNASEQPRYMFKVRASNLSGMTAAAPLMNLGIAVGGVQLSQSLPCRAKRSALVYP